jgi:hypothetical protein
LEVGGEVEDAEGGGGLGAEGDEGTLVFEGGDEVSGGEVAGVVDALAAGPTDAGCGVGNVERERGRREIGGEVGRVLEVEDLHEAEDGEVGVVRGERLALGDDVVDAGGGAGEGGEFGWGLEEDAGDARLEGAGEAEREDRVAESLLGVEEEGADGGLAVPSRGERDRGLGEEIEAALEVGEGCGEVSAREADQRAVVAGADVAGVEGEGGVVFLKGGVEVLCVVEDVGEVEVGGGVLGVEVGVGLEEGQGAGVVGEGCGDGEVVVDGGVLRVVRGEGEEVVEGAREVALLGEGDGAAEL